MLVVHMDSGLGNQMLDYLEYLIVQKNNPGKECYLENLIYELPHREGMFSMWNGYELERVFGLKIPNIREQFDDDAWSRILKNVENSRFWEENWNYSPHIVQALRREGMELHNLGQGAGYLDFERQKKQPAIRRLLTRFFQTAPGYHTKRLMRLLLQKQLVEKNKERYRVGETYPEDSYVGHSLALKYKGFGIEQMESEIRRDFQFPPITDPQNRNMLELIKSTNSVAIHARRGDMLFMNGHCYRHGFFKRSTHYIKRHVEGPVFIFFTDEDSIGWCEENEGIFGLDFQRDQVKFVTWNKGQDSFRDMQLMAQCKHNIFTESSFGFWGAYLNENPDKITCSPDCTILATNTF